MPRRKYDALQVFVRGFETQESGERIVAVLVDFGFGVTHCFDGQTDSMGGLIETDIRQEIDLEGDLDDIQEAIFAVAPPGTVIQYRGFRLTDEGEVPGPSVRLHDDGQK